MPRACLSGIYTTLRAEGTADISWWWSSAEPAAGLLKWNKQDEQEWMNNKIKQLLLLAVIALSPQFVTAAKPISVFSNFEGGALGKVERVSETHFRCGVKGESDQDGRNRQANWYYFRVDGAKGQSLTIDLIDLPGEYNYRPNRGAVTGDTLPWYSKDNQRWQQIETAEYQADVPLLWIRLTPRTNRIWFAHVPPYTNQHLQRLLREFKTHPALHQQIAGKTVQGREMLLLTSVV
jgi:Cytosolic carboxypeptidase N-terminal domain